MGAPAPDAAGRCWCLAGVVMSDNLCVKCDERGGIRIDYGDDPLCEDCRQREAEAATERAIEDYHGSASPQTAHEHYAAAAWLSRSQR